MEELRMQDLPDDHRHPGKLAIHKRLGGILGNELFIEDRSPFSVWLAVGTFSER